MIIVRNINISIHYDPKVEYLVSQALGIIAVVLLTYKELLFYVLLWQETHEQ